MKINIEYNKEILFVRLEGNLNKNNTYKINHYLINMLKKYNIKYLVFNLNKLNEIDISGMEALLNTKCIMKMNKGKMYLCNVHNRINEYLKPLKIQNIDNEFLAMELLGA